MDAKTKKWLLIGGAVALVGWFLLGRKSKAKATGGMPAIQSSWAKVKKGELVSAKSYTAGSARNPALTYVPATVGSDGLTFTPTVDGYFTRVAIQESGKWFAEIRPA